RRTRPTRTSAWAVPVPAAQRRGGGRVLPRGPEARAELRPRPPAPRPLPAAARPGRRRPGGAALGRALHAAQRRGPPGAGRRPRPGRPPRRGPRARPPRRRVTEGAVKPGAALECGEGRRFGTLLVFEKGEQCRGGEPRRPGICLIFTAAGRCQSGDPRRTPEGPDGEMEIIS